VSGRREEERRGGERGVRAKGPLNARKKEKKRRRYLPTKE
jgi:hypothetical protein